MTIVALFAISVAIIPVLGFVYMPGSASDEVTVNTNLPVSTKLEVTGVVLKQLKQTIYAEV